MVTATGGGSPSRHPPGQRAARRKEARRPRAAPRGRGAVSLVDQRRDRPGARSGRRSRSWPRSTLVAVERAWSPRQGEFDIPTIVHRHVDGRARSRWWSRRRSASAPRSTSSEYARPEAPPAPEADPRDPRRHPERRPRVTSRSGDQPEHRAEALRDVEHVHLHGGRHRRRASSRSRSWHRWPRTRCTPSRLRCARPRTGSGRAGATRDDEGRVPRRGLRASWPR